MRRILGGVLLWLCLSLVAGADLEQDPIRILYPAGRVASVATPAEAQAELARNVPRQGNTVVLFPAITQIYRVWVIRPLQGASEPEFVVDVLGLVNGLSTKASDSP